MGADGTLRVDPMVMQEFAVSLGGAAEHLMAELGQLDDQVGQMLGGWRGASGDAYGSAWELWHKGAREVQTGLAILAHLVGQAGGLYDQNEASAAQEMRGVYRG
ncbi:WXG100 family type VII secretion target [Mycobacterium sp. 852002-51057_SCH5723018]|uniref:WXG100 family type VII secretion target n=1 Tax=Mycobacterium sp. 852002-51057_SCH5723018 TaxID=1834094 RepID=UPI0007FFB473|nr:WXG100 family type VII secretion target [Mycobacterium sp. 852002-51057_SCH5723018]OBG23311.1 secretion protein [Mycobacterium sp. 852002-51057_SCH5723018]